MDATRARTFLAFIVLLAPTMMVLCASPQGQGPLRDEPDFVGFITAIEAGSGAGETGRLRVESHADKLVHRHLVKLTRDTVLLRREGSAQRRIEVRDVETRNWVRLWFSDSGRREYPNEVTARQVEVVDRP
jgi:hypothetical protein